MKRFASSAPRTARRGRVLGALAVAAVALTMVAGGAAEAKENKNAKAKAASIAEAAEIQAKVDARTLEYAGTVDGTNAYIAVVVSGKGVQVYICDGNGLSAWPQGKVARDGSFEAEAASGIKVTGTISDTAAAGTVTFVDGSEHAFTAPLATSPAGLYERLPAEDASGQLVASATIVLADGTQRGGTGQTATRTCLNIRDSARDWRVAWQQSGDLGDLAGFGGQVANLRRHGCELLGIFL